MPDRDPQTYAIIGAALEAHRHLGNGFLEAVYREAIGYELELRGVPFEREVPFRILYKDIRLTNFYRADLVCFGSVIVELKALQRLSDIEIAQVWNYLKASGLSRGLLLNVGTSELQHERLVWDHDDDRKTADAG